MEEEVNSGIIVSRGEKVRFWHLTFQEALAADALAYDPEERQRLLFGEGRLHDPQWRETVLLLAGELKKRGNDPVNKLLDRMLRNAERDGLLGHVRCAGLMGVLMKDLAAWKYCLTEQLAVRYRTTLERALSIFDASEVGTIPLENRLEAAEALGQAGDPRLRLPRDNEYWVSVPDGTFVMGESLHIDEPRHEVYLDGFLIGRFPVPSTNMLCSWKTPNTKPQSSGRNRALIPTGLWSWSVGMMPQPTVGGQAFACPPKPNGSAPPEGSKDAVLRGEKIHQARNWQT